MTKTYSTWEDNTQWSASTTLQVRTVIADTSQAGCGWEHIPTELTAATLREGAEGKNLVWFNSAEEFFAGLYDEE